MNHPFKRILSAVLVVMLCISLLSGLSFAAVVDYQTGTPAEGFENVILNWGTRGVAATYLSPNATSFYEENNVTYSELAQLSGSADVDAVPNSELYTRLQSLMVDNHTVITSYGDTRPLYSYTDCQQSDREKLTCFYSGMPIGPDWDGGATWNREHTWPNSKGMEGSDEDDIMMLRPASTSVNSSRGNKAYGEGEGFFDPSAVSGGTYNLRGDVARIFLYIYVRWGNTATPWGSDGVIESKDILLKWMSDDPVDTWEMGRNDSVESITGTRNVFIDYPELAFALFEEELPNDMLTPSGEAINTSSPYDITVVANNDAWGTVSRNGSTINAFPATGYAVSSHTLISGDAVITRNGNSFSVEASSDCTVQINFEARDAVTLQFVENGTSTISADLFLGDTYTLPEPSLNAPEGYTFQGWIPLEVAETSEKPMFLEAVGNKVIAVPNKTYYALYSRLDSAGSGSSTAFSLYTGELTEGNYLLTYDNGAMAASVTNGRLDYLDVVPAGGTVDSPDPYTVWTVGFDGKYVTLYNEATGQYAAGTGVKNKAGLLSGVEDKSRWTVTGTETYDFVNLANELKGVNKTLRKNNNYGFACYAEATGGALTLYKQVTGTMYYCTTIGACTHENTRTDAAKAPTCIDDGWTEGVFCEDCRSYISGHQIEKALGHDYAAEVTPPTVTNKGYTTYTCSKCGDSYVDNFTDALGEQFTVSFVVPNGVEPIADILCGTNAGITLPTAGVPSGEHEYRFLGWTAEVVDNADAAPTILTGKYTTEADITLYALYSYVTGASEALGWNLVTDASQLAVGDSLVLASRENGMVAGDLYSQYLSNVEAVFSEDGSSITELPATALILTLGQEEGFWTLTNAAGKQLDAFNVKKLGFDHTSGVGTWTIEIDENAGATVMNSNAEFGRFLYNVKNPRFTTYTSNTNVSMFLPQLYKLEGSMGTTYYTTVIGGAQPQGVTVSGELKTFGDAAAAATVELLVDGAVKYTLTTTGAAYSFENVEPGSYTLKVSKEDHVTREYAITVEADVAQDVKIHLLGDVTGDGRVNVADTSKVYSHVKGTAPLTDYAFACADVDANGKINVADTSKVYSHVKGSKALW